MRFFVDGSIKTPTTEYLTNPKYQQVEYLESTGTQYIDTGVAGSSTLKIEVICQATSEDKAVIGCGSASGSYDRLQIFADVSYYSCRLDGLRSMSSVSTLSKATILLDIPNKKYTINGTDVTINYSGSLSNRNMHLFGRNIPNESRDYFFQGYIWVCRIWDNNTLVRNFIPAIRKEDGKPGMYDKVTGQFFTNAGTGEFLYGNPVYNGVPKGYKECEYLESTGYQYIDTGFKPNPATTKIDCAFCALTGGSTQMFGTRTVAASTNENNTNICFGIANSKIYIRGDWIRNHENLISDIEFEEYIHLIAHNQTMYINDVEYAYDSAKNNTYLDYNFCLFACNTAGNIAFYNKIRQYYFKIYDNGILVRDMIPVLREANNELGMYDRVSNTFFTNKGTGAFTYKLKERQIEKVTRIAYSGSKMRLIRNTTA